MYTTFTNTITACRLCVTHYVKNPYSSIETGGYVARGTLQGQVSLPHYRCLLLLKSLYYI